MHCMPARQRRMPLLLHPAAALTRQSAHQAGRVCKHRQSRSHSTAQVAWPPRPSSAAAPAGPLCASRAALPLTPSWPPASWPAWPAGNPRRTATAKWRWRALVWAAEDHSQAHHHLAAAGADAKHAPPSGPHLVVLRLLLLLLWRAPLGGRGRLALGRRLLGGLQAGRRQAGGETPPGQGGAPQSRAGHAWLQARSHKPAG